MGMQRKFRLETKYIRIGLIKSVGMTNEWIAEQIEKNVSLVNREINGFGGRKDYIRKFIWKEFCKRSRSKRITFTRFWSVKFEL